MLTDNGMVSADPPRRCGRHPEMEAIFGGHVFDRACDRHGIEHRLTKPHHPWTSCRAERMNHTVKDAATKTFHYTGLGALEAHVVAFAAAHNPAKHLEAPR